MTHIVAFLLARISEDEAAADAAYDPEHPWQVEAGEQWSPNHRQDDRLAGLYLSIGTTQAPGYIKRAEAQYIAAWNPPRALEECRAKREILVMFDVSQDRETHTAAWQVMKHVVRALTWPYSGHPDFDPAWAKESA